MKKRSSWVDPVVEIRSKDWNLLKGIIWTQSILILIFILILLNK